MMNYDRRKNPSNIYSFLLVAGYLRCTEIIPQSDGNFMCRAAIPKAWISWRSVPFVRRYA